MKVYDEYHFTPFFLLYSIIFIYLFNFIFSLCRSAFLFLSFSYLVVSISILLIYEAFLRHNKLNEKKEYLMNGSHEEK